MEQEQKKFTVAFYSNKQSQFGVTRKLGVFIIDAVSEAEALGKQILEHRKKNQDFEIVLTACLEIEKETEPRDPNEAMNKEIAERCIKLYIDGCGDNAIYARLFHDLMKEISEKYPR